MAHSETSLTSEELAGIEAYASALSEEVEAREVQHASPYDHRRTERRKNLVVFDGDPHHNWVEIFDGFILPDGSSVYVVQASWVETSVSSYADGNCTLTIAPIRESEGKIKRPVVLGINPDFVLIRNQARGAVPTSDARRVLYGLMAANVPSVNSLYSMYMNLERPIMFAGLRRVQQKLGKEDFPLISQTYFSGHKEMIIAPDYPCVLKVGHAHAGMGKMKIEDSSQFRDIATVLALNNDYCTAEKFVEAEYGFRVQKVGNNYRTIKKIFTGSGWKSHFGGSVLVDDSVTEQHRRWADACSEIFGGMDLLAIDVLHGTDGKDYIIELNDTAIGFLPDKWYEDTNHVRDLVIRRMAELPSLSTSTRLGTIAEQSNLPTSRRPIVHINRPNVQVKTEANEEEGDSSWTVSFQVNTTTVAILATVTLALGSAFFLARKQ